MCIRIKNKRLRIEFNVEKLVKVGIFFKYFVENYVFLYVG